MYKAAIDIGTNSTRLLIAQCHQNRVFPIYTALETTRIGEGVGTTGVIKPLALARTLKALEDFMNKCRQYKVEKVRIAATSAVRDAENKWEVAEKVYENRYKAGNFLRKKEAELSF